MSLDTASINPKVDHAQLYIQAQMKAALDAVTAELLADYRRNHLLSRGSPVGTA